MFIEGEAGVEGVHFGDGGDFSFFLGVAASNVEFFGGVHQNPGLGRSIILHNELSYIILTLLSSYYHHLNKLATIIDYMVVSVCYIKFMRIALCLYDSARNISFVLCYISFVICQ